MNEPLLIKPDANNVVNVPKNIWDNGIHDIPIRKRSKRTPQTMGEVLSRVKELCEQLNEAESFWTENQNVDRFQKEREELQNFLNLYEHRVTAARQRLIDISNAKSALAEHLDTIATLETQTSVSAAHAQEVIGEIISQKSFQQPLEMLDKQTARTVFNHKPIRDLKGIAGNFMFSRTPAAERSLTTATVAIERMKRDLEIIASTLQQQIS